VGLAEWDSGTDGADGERRERTNTPFRIGRRLDASAIEDDPDAEPGVLPPNGASSGSSLSLGSPACVTRRTESLRRATGCDAQHDGHHAGTLQK